MEIVDGSLRCKYCQYFYDMHKEWIDFAHNRSKIKKEEEEIFMVIRSRNKNFE